MVADQSFKIGSQKDAISNVIMKDYTLKAKSTLQGVEGNIRNSLDFGSSSPPIHFQVDGVVKSPGARKMLVDQIKLKREKERFQRLAKMRERECSRKNCTMRSSSPKLNSSPGSIVWSKHDSGK